MLYSDAFRRLGGVTQVVAVGEKPLFHTRLTHTLKVAQLARRMSEHLVRDEASKPLIEAAGGLDPSAAEAAGLAHDLGHPPFGHIGEDALNAACEKVELDGYEGNAQAFRIAAKLAIHDKVGRGPGLDLSARTLNAIIKYPWMRTGPHKKSKKWNAYPTEREDFERARAGSSGEAQSLEAALMDWADDITYAVHDLEDFFRAGRVPIARLLDDKIEMASFVGAASRQLLKKDASYDVAAGAQAFGSILDLTFRNSRYYRGTREDHQQLQTASGVLINRYASAIELQDGEPVLRIPQAIRYEVDFLKQLTWHYVIHDPALATMQEGHTLVVTELFRRLSEWLEQAVGKSEEYRLPTRLRELYRLALAERGGDAYGSDDQRRARAVADYISSLTEDQAVDLYERLMGSASHSVLDPWMVY